MKKKKTIVGFLLISCLFLLTGRLYVGAKNLAGSRALSDSTSSSTNHLLKNINSKKGEKTEISVKNGEMTSGTWGTAPYTFDPATGTLTVESGDLQDPNLAPWKVSSPIMKGENIQTIDFEGSVTAPVNSSDLFSDLSNLEKFINLPKLNTSSVTDMNSMFKSDSRLTDLDLSHFDTSKVQDMRCMFNVVGTSKLDLSSFVTSNVKDMGWMFADSRALESIIFPSTFTTDQVQDMTGMFRWTAIATLNLSTFNNNLVPADNMGSMFKNMAKLKALTLGKNFSFKTINAGLPAPPTNDQYTGKWQNIGANGTEKWPKGVNVWDSTSFMSHYNGTTDADTYIWQPANTGLWGTAAYQWDAASGTLTVCAGDLQSADKAPWKLPSPIMKYTDIKTIDFEGSVTAPVNSNGLFGGLNNLVKFINISKLNTSSVTDMSNMFLGLYRLTDLDLSSFDTKNVTNMFQMFYDCRIRNLNLKSFDTRNVTNMGVMFFGARNLANLDLSSFNTKNVTNMGYMFYTCDGLSNLDLSSFNTKNVTNMGYMFAKCWGLRNINLKSFDTSNVKDMSGMFSECSALTNIDLSSLNTKNVITMSDMFDTCRGLTKLDVSQFHTENVTCMRGMFNECSSLTELNLSNFDTKNVTDMRAMFGLCSSLKKLDISNFDTSNTEDMKYLFSDCPFQSLTLGKNFKFKQETSLTSPPSDAPYLGKWQNVGVGTVEAPKGKNVWTSDEFKTSYNGQTDADTYVWAKRPVTIPVITAPQVTHGTVPAEKNGTLEGTGSPFNQLTLQTYVSATQTWEPIKNATTTVSDTGKWVMKNIDLINTAQFRIVAQFPQDDTVIAKTQPFTALEPSIPRLISPKQTNQTIPAQTEATFSGTGQADDQLRVEIRTNATAPWETKGQTQVDAQGKWEVKGITTQDNQEVRLVTQRPGGTQEAISPTWTVNSNDTFTGIANVTYDSGDTPIPGDNWELIIPTSYDFTGGNNPGPDGKPGLAVKGNVRLTDPYGNTYNGDKTVDVAVLSKNKGVLKNDQGTGKGTYQLQDDKGTPLKFDGSVPIASLAKGSDKDSKPVNAALTRAEQGQGLYHDILSFTAEEKTP